MMTSYVWWQDMVAYTGLLRVCMRDLGAIMCILCGPQGPFTCSLLYVYAFRAKTHMDHGMVCCCIDIDYIWYGESFIRDLSPSYYYACEPYGSHFAWVIPGKSRVPSKDGVGDTQGGVRCVQSSPNQKVLVVSSCRGCCNRILC